MELIHRTSELLNSLVEKTICLLLAGMTAVTFAQVVCRLIQGSLPWSEELSRYMMVYLTFLGLSVGVKRGVLINIEAFMNLFPPQIQNTGALFVTLLNMAFFTYSSVTASKLSCSRCVRLPQPWASKWATFTRLSPLELF